MELPICTRCVCLHSHIIDDDLICKPDSIIKDLLVEKWPSMTDFLNQSVVEDHQICSSCLGALQDDFLNNFVETVVKAFKADGYVCKNFKLDISLPVQMVLFIENARSHHENAFRNIGNSDRGYAIKELMKVYIEPLIEKELHIPAIAKGDKDIEVSVILKHIISDEKLLPQLVERFPKCFSEAQRYSNTTAKKRAIGRSAIYNASTLSNVLNVVSSSELSELIVAEFFKRGVEVDDVNFLRSPVYLGGRYCKFDRHLSQTPWTVDGKRISEMSVQEYMTLPTQKLFSADDCNFSSSGREDIDVRMLGSGRPFLIELMNARMMAKYSDIVALQNEINKSTDKIQIYDLQIVGREDVKMLKDGEEKKTKSYSAICYSMIPPGSSKTEFTETLVKLSQRTNVKIKQKTPIRVLHRRNLAIRERMIYTLKVSFLTIEEAQKLVSVNEKFSENIIVFNLEMTTQAGTYVKEFVHGDLGRTVPSMNSLLGTYTDILCLDVTAVNLDWPPCK